jgi:hypothetical protein
LFVEGGAAPWTPAKDREDVVHVPWRVIHQFFQDARKRYIGATVAAGTSANGFFCEYDTALRDSDE